MAHFAELDENNIVVRVLVFDDADVNANGGDQSQTAASFCETIVPFSETGVKWVQTSFNNNFRKQYASKGFTYNPTQNVFIKPQPFSSWSLDGNNDWQAPITYPTVTEEGDITYYIYWNETAYQADNSTGWETTKSNDTSENPTIYKWNGTTWIS
mgnify:CR=1 FL=1|jgi:hypothetical protein|tara:strand:- start:101 stop:565 length:465 start_codon:yes stop_codon:yes gene_type:complete